MVAPFNKTNTFDLTHEHSLTCEMGYLVPSMLMEVVPGDTFRVTSDIFTRLQAMIAPIYQRVDIFQHFFYVPKRILFADWEKYITGGFDGQDNTSWPYMVAPSGGYAAGSLADYLGLPIGVAGYEHSALPFRAYAKIMNDWYRDENNQSMLTISDAAGLDTTTNTTLQRRCWEKDYFTSALPWPQRGTQVNLPLGTTAPVSVYGNGKALGIKTANGNAFAGYSQQSGDYHMVSVTDNTIAGSGKTPSYDFGSGTGAISAWGVTTNASNSGLKGLADLSQATAATINDLRVSFQIQKYMEKTARGGARLVEWTLSHFGVRVPDARLQRSEYLGGGRSALFIMPVEQTSSTDSTSPQGHLAGRAESMQRSMAFTKTFTEEGFVIGLLSIMPRTLYSQGLQRLWTRKTRYDHYLPVFAHLGEQEIKNEEIYTQAPTVVDSDGNPVNDGTFGYAPRYNELRHIPSSVHGQFRAGQTLEFYTQARNFSNLPQLGSTFVECDPSNRIFAVTDGVDHCEVQVLHHVKALRPMPKHGTPGLIDHD